MDLNDPTKNASPIGVLIVDDHPVFRKGMIDIISDFDQDLLIREAGDGLEALQVIDQHPIDLVFLDIQMPRLNGFETADRINQLSNPPKIIVLTMHDDLDYIHTFYEKNAWGYILKNTTYEEVHLAMSLVLTGERYFSRHVLQKMLLTRQPHSAKKSVDQQELTPQEQKVVKYICLQKSNEQIAELLTVSIFTVRRHRQNIKEKIGVKNDIGLLIYAVKTGIIETSDIDLL